MGVLDGMMKPKKKKQKKKSPTTRPPKPNKQPVQATKEVTTTEPNLTSSTSVNEEVERPALDARKATSYIESAFGKELPGAWMFEKIQLDKVMRGEVVELSINVESNIDYSVIDNLIYTLNAYNSSARGDVQWV